MQQRVADAHYIGIYARCSGLNAARFCRKTLHAEQWRVLFAFYMELWIGQLILQTAREFISDSCSDGTFDEAPLTATLCGLFDAPPVATVTTLEGFSKCLRQVQRDLDLAVNSAGFGMPKIRQPEVIAIWVQSGGQSQHC